jgi:hypothetical protein
MDNFAETYRFNVETAFADIVEREQRKDEQMQIVIALAKGKPVITRHSEYLRGLDEGMAMGYEIAITTLRNVERLDDNAGITACLHSTEWAQYLEEKKGAVL